MKKMTTLLLAASTVLGLVIAPATSAFAQEIDREEELTIGFDNTFAPFGFTNPEGENVGFDLDVAAEVFGRMEVEYEFQPIDWAMKETELNSGQIDAIWNGYSVTPEREEVVLFSSPYVQNRQVIIVKDESEVETKADLAGKIIATQEQSASLEAIMKEEDFASSIDGGVPVTYPTFVEVFADLDNGRVEAIVVDELMALYFLEQRGDADQYRVLEENFGTEDYAVGFRQSDEAFVNDFNEVLAEVIEDGTFAEIQGKWFAGIDLPEEGSEDAAADSTEEAADEETTEEAEDDSAE